MDQGFITWQHRQKQPLTLTYTPTYKKEFPIHFTCMFWGCGRKSNRCNELIKFSFIHPVQVMRLTLSFISLTQVHEEFIIVLANSMRHDRERKGYCGGRGYSLVDELDLPMSASERWMGFLVWCRCFRSSTKLIFSRSSGERSPSSTCRSTISSAWQNNKKG